MAAACSAAAASAISTVVWPRLLNPVQLAALIRQQKSPSAALRLFTAAPLLYPTTYRHTPAVLSALFDSLSSSPSHLPSFFSHLRHFLLHSPPSRELDPLLSRAFNSLPVADALSLFRLLPLSSLPCWPRSFQSMLRILISNNDLVAAHQLLVESSHRSESQIGLESLNLVIGSLCRLGRSDLALDIFMEIKEQCCYPNRETYRILMHGLCESGRLDDAIHLLYSMLWRISQKGCEADVVVYRVLLEALCDNGRVKEAEDVLGKVLLKGLRTPRKRRAFQKVELQGLEPEEMKRRIDEALVVGGVRSLKSYAAVIGDLYEEGKAKNAQKMFDEMCRRGFRPTVAMFERKVEALCREGRVEDGIRVLEVEMKEKGCVPSVIGYELVMKRLCGEGKVMRAMECFEMMERQLGCVTRKDSFEILVDGLLREAHVLEAVAVLEKMTRRKFWAETEIYCRVIRGLCSIGRRYEAVLWLEEMVSRDKVPESVWSSLVSVVCVDYDKAELVSCLDPLVDD